MQIIQQTKDFWPQKLYEPFLSQAGQCVFLHTNVESNSKCCYFFDSSATNAIIAAKDHASVQISVADVDEEGRMTGGFKTYAFCGKVRGMVSSDVIRGFSILIQISTGSEGF